MCNLKKPSKIYIIRPNIKVQAAESHISLGLMNGFLEIDIDCQIISGIKFLPENRKNILIIDDLANYRSEEDIKTISNISKEGAVVALWVHWPILKSAKYFDLHNLLISKHLNLFEILYGEREVESMMDFQKFTKRQYYKIPNASPPLPTNEDFKEKNINKKDNFDIVFIGSKMKSKSFIFKKVLPLLKKENPNIKIGLFGRGFNKRVRIANAIIKISNKLVAPFSLNLNNFVTNKMVQMNQVITKEREVNIYRNSKICINYHEDTPKHIIYNLRYFKIPFFGGFQLVDSPLKKSPYFTNEEVFHIDSDDEKEWVKKINYFLRNPLERYRIQLKGNQKAIEFHSYKERAKLFIKIYDETINQRNHK
tara:strand:+ start:169 stop:1266 length:1098 start_codon:yes stop_codon:yes gene_type:complete